MLLVEARIAPSKIHGFGLIAKERICKGTTIWTWHPAIDIVIPMSTISSLSATAQNQVCKYSWLEDGSYFLCGDDARFMNHANKPNTKNNIAIRNIEINEEITCDYGEFDEREKVRELANKLNCTKE